MGDIETFGRSYYIYHTTSVVLVTYTYHLLLSYNIDKEIPFVRGLKGCFLFSTSWISDHSISSFLFVGFYQNELNYVN